MRKLLTKVLYAGLLRVRKVYPGKAAGKHRKRESARIGQHQSTNHPTHLAYGVSGFYQ